MCSISTPPIPSTASSVQEEPRNSRRLAGEHSLGRQGGDGASADGPERARAIGRARQFRPRNVAVGPRILSVSVLARTPDGEALQCFIYAEMPRRDSLGKAPPGKQRKKAAPSSISSRNNGIIAEVKTQLAKRYGKGASRRTCTASADSTTRSST